MNTWATLSVVGFILSPTLIIYTAFAISKHPDMSDMFVPIAALVLFSIIWILSTGVLIYQLCISCREAYRQRALHQPDRDVQAERVPFYSNHIINRLYAQNQHATVETGPPLVPSLYPTPTAPPAFGHEDD